MEMKVVLILIFIWTASACITDSNCNNGKCTTKNTCECNSFFGGNDCSVRWEILHPPFRISWFTYVGIALALNSIFLAVSVFQLYLNIRYSKHKFSVISQCLLGIATSSLVRVSYFASNPHNYFGYFSVWGSYIFYTIPVAIKIDVCCLVVLYWMEIHSNKKAMVVTSVQRLRKLYLGILFSTTLIFIGLGVALKYMKETRSLVITYWCFVVASIFCIGIVGKIYSKRIADSILKSERSEAFESFSQKLKKLAIILGILFLAMLITVVVYIPLSIHQNKDVRPYSMVTINTVILIEESTITICLLVLLQKKRSILKRKEIDSNSSERIRDSISPEGSREVSRQPTEI